MVTVGDMLELECLADAEVLVDVAGARGRSVVEVAALALAHADVILERSRRIVRENLEVLMEWVASEPHLSIVRPEAGTTALVYYDYPIESRDFCVKMMEAEGALVTPGDCFEEPRSFRVGYAYSDNPDALREGLAAISRFLRTLEG